MQLLLCHSTARAIIMAMGTADGTSVTATQIMLMPAMPAQP